MTSRAVAVVGVASPVGRAVLSRLAAVDGLDRVLAVDAETPPMLPPRVTARMMDARDRLLPLVLDDVDVVVHCAFSDDLSASADSLYGINVGGTRNVLEAASKAGVEHLVVMSTTMVYGAHPDNPLPLTESAVVHANPGFAYAYQRQLVEEMVQEWAARHPATTVTVLRLAPVMGPGVDSAVVRRLQAPRLPVPRGLGAPWQLVHVDDVAAATELVVREGVGGTFNVAADGWLSATEVATYLGRPLVEVGHATVEEVIGRAWRLGLSPAPPEVAPYLLHPWVADNAALRARGWTVSRSNREILAEFAAANADVIAVGRLTFSRRGLRATGAGLTGLLLLSLWRLVRRGSPGPSEATPPADPSGVTS